MFVEKKIKKNKNFRKIKFRSKFFSIDFFSKKYFFRPKKSTKNFSKHEHFYFSTKKIDQKITQFFSSDFSPIFFDQKIFDRKFFEHIDRLEIFPGIECAHLENQPTNLNTPKLNCFLFFDLLQHYPLESGWLSIILWYTSSRHTILRHNSCHHDPVACYPVDDLVLRTHR